MSSALDPTVPFRKRGAVPDELGVPGSLAGSVVVVALVGIVLGLWLGNGAAQKAVRCFFYSAGFTYLVVSIFDFKEHFRLEKLATGRRLSWVVVPWGETINHILTGLALLGLFILARPIHPPLAPRDWYSVLTPGLFLLLGWRDELVYHRRRAAHREDIMHTTAHLAAAAMLASFVAMRMIPW